MKKFIAVLGLSRLTIPQKIETTRSYVIAMTGNPYFVSVSPTLLSISGNATALETAYVAASSGAIGLKAAMHSKVQTLDISLKLLAAYVEGIANASPSLGSAIILSAGMKEKKASPPKANGFRIASTKIPGEVSLRTNWANNSTFLFQVTTTPATETSWTLVNSGTKASCLATELVSGTRYYFRVCKTDKSGISPWSTILDIIAS